MGKSVAFPHANNEQLEKVIKKITPSVTESKRIKYLGINFTKSQETCILKTTQCC
jgi:hypothetical protein